MPGFLLALLMPRKFELQRLYKGWQLRQQNTHTHREKHKHILFGLLAACLGQFGTLPQKAQLRIWFLPVPDLAYPPRLTVTTQKPGVHAAHIHLGNRLQTCLLTAWDWKYFFSCTNRELSQGSLFCCICWGWGEGQEEATSKLFGHHFPCHPISKMQSP